jgi:cell division protein FtsB
MGTEDRLKRLMEISTAVRHRLYSLRRRFATAAVVVIAGWIAYHSVFGPNGMLIYSHKRTELRSVQKEVEALREENQRLQQHVDALKNDPKTIEKEAREQLRYARPGEVIYTISRPAPQAETATAQKR